MEIICPSKLRGTIRGMKGREAQAFVDPTLMRTHGSMDSMLRNCWLQTEDPGPYANAMKGAKDGKTAPQPPWSDGVLLGDRFAATIDIRIATFGPDYDFKVKCVDCKKQYDWELRLADLPRRDFPDSTLEKIAAGVNLFEVALPDGLLMRYQLSTGVEERKVMALTGGAGSTRKLGPVDAICVQATGNGKGIYAFRGEDRPGYVPSVHATWSESDDGRAIAEIPGGPNGVRRYLEDLDLAALMGVLEDMQAPDGGIDTKIETICTFCGWQQEIALPFQETFFNPRRVKKAV